MATRWQFLQWLATLGIEPPLLEPRIVTYEPRPARWPRELDLTIALLADIHACKPWMDQKRIGRIVDQTNALGADLILLLGDYVAGHVLVTGFLKPDEWAERLGKLSAPLGVHAVLGNHDWWDDRIVQRSRQGSPSSKRALEAVGILVYENDAVRIVKDEQPFWLAGLGDQRAFMPSRYSPSHYRRPERKFGVDDLPRTLAQVTDDAPMILMAHEPDIVMQVPDRVALTLSGHTHGGQVRLFGWAPVVPSRYGSRFAYGHFSEPSDLIVTGGLGCTGLPIRVGMPPEIVPVRLGQSG